MKLSSVWRIAIAVVLVSAAHAAAPSPPARAETATDRIAVFLLGATAHDRHLAANLSEVLISRAAGASDAEIAGIEELRARMTFATEEQAGNCLVEMSCLTRVAVSLGVRRAISGTVAQRPGHYIFALSLTDLEDSTVVRRVFRRVDGRLDDLIRAAQAAIDELFRPQPKPGALRITEAPPGSRVFVDDVVMGAAPLSVPTLAAGLHRVRIEAEARFPWRSTVEIPAGRSIDLRLDDRHLPPRYVWPTRAVWLTGGASLVALATGAIFGTLAADDPSGVTRGASQRDLERKERYATISHVSFGAGAVTAAASVFLAARYRHHIFGRPEAAP